MRRAALAGILGPVGFLLVAFALSIARHDVIVAGGWKSWPSSMALGGVGGLPQTANFLALGLCYLVFSIGALRPMLHRRSAWVGFLVVAAGEGLLAFPTDAAGTLPTWHGRLHLAGVIVVTIATLAATAGVTLEVRNRRGWRSWRYIAPVPVLAAALGSLAGFDRGWAKVTYVIGITLPVAVIGLVLSREASGARSAG